MPMMLMMIILLLTTTALTCQLQHRHQIPQQHIRPKTAGSLRPYQRRRVVVVAPRVQRTIQVRLSPSHHRWFLHYDIKALHFELL